MLVSRVSEKGLVYYDNESETNLRGKESFLRLDTYLNELGNQGWELIDMSEYVFIFKKIIS